VQFRSSGDAHNATKLNGTRVGSDLNLVVKISDPTRREDRHGPVYEGREIHISNIDWKANEGDLKEVFQKYGTIETVRIPRKVDGGSKGFGYIVFSTKVCFLAIRLLSFIANLSNRRRQKPPLLCMNRNSARARYRSESRRPKVLNELQPLS
jgi:hypothetical protein